MNVRWLHGPQRRALAASAAGLLLLATLGSAAGMHLLASDHTDDELWMVDQDLAAVIAASTAAPGDGQVTSEEPVGEAAGTSPLAALSVAAPGTDEATAIDTSAFDTDAPRGIPALVLTSYQRAAKSIATNDPACGLPWWLLAGIGKIESGHAAGGRVDADGTTRGEIVGPRLDGTLAGTAVIRDTDGGRLDGDRAFDRAVGPMQFLPTTWGSVGADGNADGKRNPHNVFDASLTAGRYLCGGSARLTTDDAMTGAILRYNQSATYARDVLAWAHAYRDGALVVPDATGPIPVKTTAADTPSTPSRTTPAPTQPTRGPSPTTTAPPTTAPTAMTKAPTAPPTTTPPPTPTTGEPSGTTMSTSPTPTPSVTDTPTVEDTTNAPTTTAGP